MNAPNYSNIGDHTEAVQVDYDPGRITYAQLLDIFWENHRPTGRSWSRQYMKAVFYHDEHQHQLAMASKTAVKQKIAGTVKTEVAPLRSFTMAEDYHQKYILKQNRDLMRELQQFYPDHQDLVASTSAARMNGYTGGNGTADQLSKELSSLGLSADGEKVLKGMVR